MADVDEKEKTEAQNQEADKSTYQFWKDLETATGYDAEIFQEKYNGKEKVHYDDLVGNVGYLSAAQKVLEIGWGGLDEKYKKSAAEIVKDPALAAELVDDARTYISWFNNNIGRTVEIAAKVKAATPEQQLAFLYAMDVHDRVSIDWTSPVNLLFQGVATDPTIWGAIVAGAFSFGTGTAAGVVGRQAAKEAAKELLEQSIKYGAKKSILKGMALGATFGAADAVITDPVRQALNMSEIKIGDQTISRQNEFSFGELAGSTVMGAGFGAAFAGGGHYGAKGARSLSRTFGLSTAKATDNVAEKAAKIALDETDLADEAARLAEQFGTAGTEAQYRAAAGQNLRLRKVYNLSPEAIEKRAEEILQQAIEEGADIDPDQSAFRRTNQAICELAEEAEDAAMQSTKAGAKAAPSSAAAGSAGAKMGGGVGGTINAGSTSGPQIALPEFKPTRDWFKTWMRRSANPLKLFTHWAPVTNMPMRSVPITRPVIQAVDNLVGAVDANGKIGPESLLKKIQGLEHKILEEVKNGGDVAKIINDFKDDATNAADLAHFSKEVERLKQHVIDTYTPLEKTNAYYKWINLFSEKSVTRKYLNKFFEKMPDTLFAGPHAKTGITIKQKTALVAYLDDMANMANDLQKGTKGEFGKQMLDVANKIQAGELTASQISESVTRISHANFLVDNAETRITGYWAHTAPEAKDKANLQWKLILERSIQDGYYNPHKFGKPIPLQHIRKENIERQWQNQILVYYQTIGGKAEDGSITSVNWTTQNAPPFINLLKQMYDAGLGHDAFYTIDDLARRRQKWKRPEIMTFPDEDLFKTTLEADKRYGTDRHYTKWVDELVTKVTDEHRGAAGAARPPFGRFMTNRPNMEFYAMESYPYRYSRRYAYTSRLAVPGRNYWMNRLILTPLKNTGAWLGGGKEVKTKIDPEFSMRSPDIKWRGEKEGSLSIPRRALVRLATGGLMSDWHSPSKYLGWPAIASGTIWAAGSFGEYPWMEKTGEIGVDVTTYPIRKIYTLGGATLFGESEDTDEKKKKEKKPVTEETPDSTNTETPPNSKPAVATPPGTPDGNGGNVMILQGDDAAETGGDGPATNGAGGEQGQNATGGRHGQSGTGGAENDETIGGVIADGWDGLVDMTTVDSDDKVTRVFNRSVKAIGNGLGSAWNWATDTFRDAKRSKTGQAWLGLGGGVAGGFLANLLGMALFKKIGIGDWPIVGTLLSIGLFIVGFMGGRKLTHNMMPAVAQGDLSHVSTEEKDAKAVTSTNHEGGTLKTEILFKDEADRYAFDQLRLVQDEASGQWVVQGNDDNDKTRFVDLKFLNPGAVEELGKYGNRSFLPRAITDKLKNDFDNLHIEMVEHIPSEARVITIGKDRHLIIPKDMSPTPAGP